MTGRKTKLAVSTLSHRPISLEGTSQQPTIINKTGTSLSFNPDIQALGLATKVTLVTLVEIVQTTTATTPGFKVTIQMDRDHQGDPITHIFLGQDIRPTPRVLIIKTLTTFHNIPGDHDHEINTLTPEMLSTGMVPLDIISLIHTVMLDNRSIRGFHSLCLEI